MTDQAATTDAAVFSRRAVEPPLAIFAPLHYEPNYAYPLIVWLHGSGDSEKQLLRIMPRVSMRNYVAVAPRGQAPSAKRGDGFVWTEDTPHIDHSTESILASIEYASQRFHISHNRMFLAGFGSGGTLALRIALADPARFAGAVSLCGPLPTGSTPFGRLKEARRLTFMIATGANSTTYPYPQVLDDLRLMRAAGIPTELHQYDCGDEICGNMLADMDRFMMRLIADGQCALGA